MPEQFRTRQEMRLLGGGRGYKLVAELSQSITVSDGTEGRDDLFRHFPREVLERLNEVLDDTSGHVPLIARLAYMLTLPSETYHRSQTDVAEILGLSRRVVNYQLITYFPQACPRKALKGT